MRPGPQNHEAKQSVFTVATRVYTIKTQSALLLLITSRCVYRTKPACARSYESCSYQHALPKTTTWPVGQWICELQRQPRRRQQFDLGLYLEPHRPHATLTQSQVLLCWGVITGAEPNSECDPTEVIRKPATTLQSLPPSLNTTLSVGFTARSCAHELW